MNMKYLLACSVAAVSIGTAMADPKPTVFPHGIAGSSNVMTSAGAVQGTLSDAVIKAQGSVQKTDANQKNGYAKLDGSGNVTVPVTGSVAAASADATGDTVSTIADTAKSGSALAATAVQKSQVGAANGVAPLDSNKMMSAPVSGDLSSASITNNNLKVNLSNYLATGPVNIKDYCGNIKIGQQIGDAACVQNAVNSIGSGKILNFYGNTVWNSPLIPDTTNSGLSFVNFNGYVINPPGVSDPISGSGVDDIIPDAVVFSTGSNYAPTQPGYERYSTQDHSYTPMFQFRQLNDGPSANQQGSEVVRIAATSSIHSTGNMDGLRTYLRSSGINYAGSFDVNKWSSTQSYGTNWIWDNISEMANAVPYYCPSDASGNGGLCSEYDMNELDLDITGPEKPESAYDPSKSTRHVIGAGNGFDQMRIDGGTHVAWKANNPYFQNQIIIVNDSNNKPYLFYAWNKAAPSDKIGDDPQYGFTGSISGSTLTVTDTGTTQIPIDKSDQNSAKCGVMVGWLISNKQINKEVKIISQISGTPCYAGTYQIQDMTASTTDLTVPSGTIHEAQGQPWSTSGSTAPAWTFNKGDKITDGTVVWTGLGPFTADTGSVIKYSGGNDPDSGLVTRFGTLLETDTIWCYNALIDFSTAAFDPSLAYKVDMRVQPDTYFDLTADATQAGQNNHLFGYSSADNAVEIKNTSGTLFSINDSGTLAIQRVIYPTSGNHTLEIAGSLLTDSGETVGGDLQVNGNITGLNGLMIGGKTKAQLLQITNATEGQSYFDVTDHAQVTWLCPSPSTCAWHPVQYGTALSN